MLTQTQQLIAERLSTGADVKDVSKELNINRVTIWEYKTKNSEFKRYLDSLVEQRLDALRQRFQGAAELAFETLLNLCKDASPRIKLEACKAILDRAGISGEIALKLTKVERVSEPKRLTEDEINLYLESSNTKQITW